MSSIAKVFQVIEAVVAHQERGLAYSEVVAETRLPKATAHRILKSLAGVGYLRFDAEVGRYFGDLKLAALGSAVTSHFDLKPYVRPHLLQLRAETRHTCNLGVLSGDDGVYLDKLESLETFGVKLYSEIGKRFPLHCTGMGKVLLADMPAAERRQLLARRLEAFTPHTITDSVALERELRKVRRCGYALDQQEITRGIMCVAAPVRDGEGKSIAAISVAFPAYIEQERGIQDEIRAVTRCAAAISRQFLTAPVQEATGRAKVQRLRSGPNRRRRVGVRTHAGRKADRPRAPHSNRRAAASPDGSGV
jgi:DNA-binding IclR family transcriptional regulator